jgi:hypothetical protein
MTNIELQKQLDDLDFVFLKFSQVSKLIDSPITTSSTIQRFEAAFAACWDVMSKMLTLRGLVPDSKLETIQMAYDMQFIQTDNIWRDMLNDVESKVIESDKPIDEYYTRIKKTYYNEIHDVIINLREKSA